MVGGKARIAVMVSGGGTNLQALLDAGNKGIIKSGEICLVISDNPKAYALERAKAAGIETVLMIDEKNVMETIRSKGIDLIVLAGFLKILSSDFVGSFENRMINIHPSLIPSFCGKGCYGIHVHEKALDYGVKVTGATVHFVNEIPDGGRIIAQKAVYIEENDSPEVLQRRVMEQAEWIILPESVEKICSEIVGGML